MIRRSSPTDFRRHDRIDVKEHKRDINSYQYIDILEKQNTMEELNMEQEEKKE